MARVLMNAAGEAIMPAHELEVLAKRVMRLTGEQIDELWARCGWSDIEAEAEGQRSLSRERIETIRYDFSSACECIESLIICTPGAERGMRELFKRNLTVFEEECKQPITKNY